MTVGKVVPKYQSHNTAVETNTVSEEPKLSIICFEKNMRGQTFFRMAGADPEAELMTLKEDLGTENINTINSLMRDIRQMAMQPVGEMNADVFYSILAKVRDAKPRSAKQRQFVVLQAGVQTYVALRLSEINNCESIPQDANGISALKTLTRLVNELDDALEQDDAPRPVVNVLNVNEGTSRVVHESVNQIEHNLDPPFEFNDNEPTELEDVKEETVAKTTGKAPVRRYRPKRLPHG